MEEQLNLFDVAQVIENEGFDYCMRNFSDWAEVKDAEFHRLREAYVAAADALEEYVRSNSDDPLWEDI